MNSNIEQRVMDAMAPEGAIAANRQRMLEGISKPSAPAPVVLPDSIVPDPGPGKRLVQRRLGHDKWEDTEFMKLTSGCTFRMFEADGRPVVDKYGHSSWIAAGKPYIDGEKNMRIKTY